LRKPDRSVSEGQSGIVHSERSDQSSEE
jgi:hypothetical protein